MKLPPPETHPEGEVPKSKIAQGIDKIAVDTYGGRVSVDWAHDPRSLGKCGSRLAG
jgi:hypothetical protein